MTDDKKDEKWYYTFLPYNIAGGSTNPIIPLFVTEGLKGTVAQVGIVSAITSLAAVPANISVGQPVRYHAEDGSRSSSWASSAWGLHCF